MSPGHDKPLYILPFDHRSSFQKGLYGWMGELSPEQTDTIASTKDVIYEGFKMALGKGAPTEHSGILVDPQFGDRILRDAADNGHITCMPVEKAGRRSRVRVRRAVRRRDRGLRPGRGRRKGADAVERDGSALSARRVALAADPGPRAGSCTDWSTRRRPPRSGRRREGAAMSEMSTTDTEARFKKEAAESAVELVESGMKVGLGTGSTAIFATRRIGAMLKAGELRDIVAFATSRATADEAVRLGIPMPPDDLPEDLDLTIDGADEVDPELNLIKGGGGALLREKVVAQVSARKVIVVDETKSSPRLGERRALPVEVIPFGWRSQERYLESLGATITVRQGPDGAQFVTDSGNMILDCRFGPIADPGALAEALATPAGIVEHGLFIGLATDLITAGPQGIRHRTRQQ